jgi:adenylosuccinate synthase
VDQIDEPGVVKPVYEELDGWTEELASVRVLDDLPKAARAYVRFLEEGAGVPLYLVSVGPRRRETIVLHNPFVGRAAAP